MFAWDPRITQDRYRITRALLIVPYIVVLYHTRAKTTALLHTTKHRRTCTLRVLVETLQIVAKEINTDKRKHFDGTTALR